MVIPVVISADAPVDTPLILLWPFVKAALGHVPKVFATLVTFTLTVQVVAALTAAAVTTTELAPAAALTKAGAATCTPPAGQLLVTAGVAATISPDGNVSVKLKPVRTVLPVPVLLMVNVSTAVPPPPMVATLKVFVSAGSAATVKPLDVTLLVRFVVVTLAVVLLYGPPATLLVTLTVTVHVT